ncbi:MAG: hypothetical protein FJ143_13230 [Deltaproteobacteria bacterium]|nr:hypothetical protein [Deltaproteobacteria bacterium]
MSKLSQAFGRGSSPANIAFAAFLTKLAKHLALIACLAIVGQATGRMVVGQLAILFLIVSAALVNTVGATVSRRWRHASSHQRDAP